MSIDKNLQSEILSMVREDQLLRQQQASAFKKLIKKKQLNPSIYKKEVNLLIKQLGQVDQKNTNKLKLIIKKVGWPGISLVGKRGAQGAWLIAQHAVHDPDFQKKCLNLLLKGVNEGEVERKHWAYLLDRIRVREGKKQIYGTQFKGDKDGNQSPYPIIDPSNLNQRRAEVGLESFAEYKRKMEATG